LIQNQEKNDVMIEMSVLDKKRKVPTWLEIFEETNAKLKELNDKSTFISNKLMQ
jgi:hypothetical protein